MATERGRFVTFEGVEGAGKSTQLELLLDWLRHRGVDPLVTREPGGTATAEQVRALLLDSANTGIAPDAELLLVFAARADHIAHWIEPALAAGRWVLCDRFTDATYAYQGGGRQLDWQRIAWLERFVQHGLEPDLTLLFDLPVREGLARAHARSAMDRFEREDLAFFERVQAAYQLLAEQHSDRIEVIPADRPAAEIAADVRRCVSRRLLDARLSDARLSDE